MNDADKVKELESELATYKVKGYIGYYYELNRWVNGTVTLMRERGVKSLLSAGDKDEEKDAKKFEKMMTLIKNTKEWIDNMEEIKTKFNLTGDEEKDKSKQPFINRVAEARS